MVFKGPVKFAEQKKVEGFRGMGCHRGLWRRVEGARSVAASRREPAALFHASGRWLTYLIESSPGKELPQNPLQTTLQLSGATSMIFFERWRVELVR